MLYTKPAEQVTEQDILQFIQGTDLEGTTFDVKKDFPDGDKLPKLIAAFANTYGGIIIIGVDGKNGAYNPVGIEYKQDYYKTKITNQLYNKVHPVVTPEIKVVPLLPGKNKCLILIRIPQSPYAPHSILGTNEIPYRYNDRVGLMDTATICRLLDQRKADVNHTKNSGNALLALDAIYFSLAPSFNVNPVVFSATLEEGIRKIVAKYIIAHPEPVKRTRNSTVFGKEMVQLHNNEKEEGYGITIASNGNIAVYFRDTSIINTDKLDLFETVRMHKKFFFVAIEILKLFGYYGNCEIEFIITSARKNGRRGAVSRPIKGVNIENISIDQVSLFGFSDNRQISYHELKDPDYLKVLFLIYNDLLRDCNVSPTENDLRSFLKSPAVV